MHLLVAWLVGSKSIYVLGSVWALVLVVIVWAVLFCVLSRRMEAIAGCCCIAANTGQRSILCLYSPATAGTAVVLRVACTRVLLVGSWVEAMGVCRVW